MRIIENVEVPEFKPVHIVLESQGEVDLLASLLGHTSVNSEKVFGVDINKMYDALNKHAVKNIRPKATIVFEVN